MDRVPDKPGLLVYHELHHGAPVHAQDTGPWFGMRLNAGIETTKNSFGAELRKGDCSLRQIGICVSIRVFVVLLHESCQIDVPADVVTHDRLCFVIADWCGVCGIHIAGV